MKISPIIIFTLFLTGCASQPPGAALTAEQARSVALQLANDKAFTVYQCRPFRDGQPARFVSGRWEWAGREGYGHGDIEAIVALAADGSTNHVDLQLFDSQNELLLRY
jgi:hypothetical protein